MTPPPQFLGELLRDVGEVQNPQHAVSSVAHGSCKADGMSISLHLIAMTLELPGRKEVEISMERLMAAAESAAPVTAPHPKSKAGSGATTALHQLRCQAQKQGITLTTSARC